VSGRRRAWAVAVLCALTAAGSGTDEPPAAPTPAIAAALDRLRPVAGEGDRARLMRRLGAVEDLRAALAAQMGPSGVGPAGAERAAAWLLLARELAALGLLDEAAWELERGLGDPTAAVARAPLLLELAHVERRRGRLDRARAHYEHCLGESALSPAERGEVRLWQGRLALEAGEAELGRRILVAVAHGDADPHRSLTAFDCLARERITSGALEAAAGWLEQARSHWAAVAAEHTPRGDRVRRGLMRMGAVVELRAALFGLGRSGDDGLDDDG
jgi:hypothetical protein